MKYAALPAAVLLVLFLITGSANAASPEAELVGLDKLENAEPDAAKDAYGALSADQVLDFQTLLERLWSYLSGRSEDLVSSALHSGAEILLISFLSVLCCSVSDSKVLPVVGAASAAISCVKNVSSCAAVGKQALATLADYSHVLLPCLSTAAAVTGAWTSAGAKYSASILFIDLIITAEQTIAYPALCAYAAVAIAAHLTENPFLLSVSGFVKQILKWSLVLFTVCFTVYLSLTGILSGAVDAAAAKTAKSVISSALPVVGGIISDASGAILSGIQMLRNEISMIGMLVILAVCVSPYLMLGSHYLVFQIAAGLVSSFGNRQIGSVIRCVGDVYGFLLGIVGSVSIMLFVSVVSLMKAVSPG